MGEEMKPTDEAKRLSYEIADEYLPDVNILGVDGPNTGLADEIINKVMDAAWPDIEIMQQAMFEMKHAQLSGPGWYTRGESGLKQQVRMWIDKGLKASESINKLRP